ncbi:Sister chromatid cohesion protein DCC1 [Psilocybe cubensis]|uniref:Sister chromatid cohesion protein DCC1 n=2 Tax=Psilocybe cubensis TaxID=181762 RepID=A0ACB8H5F1_PSICU|nr:Sister chromatid cohesion protein DCC1 [Psilocybe cubensis]KAH9482726.1 Sister chromatid cohesion protein DCC1 [Psilocybe cubensis]
MPEYDLCFSFSSTNEAGSYKIIELTPDLTTLIETAIAKDEDPRLSIKGQPDEDAVLCSSTKTYGMRSVGLSNTVLVVTPVPDERASEFAEDAVIIRDQLNEIIELAPVVPKLHKLSALIKNREYDGDNEDEDDDGMDRFTYHDAKQEIQASDVEIDQGLKTRRVLIINNELRPIAPAFLAHLLELILNLLVSLSMNYTSVSVEALSSALADDHEVSRAVSTQVMSWFGEIKDAKWKMDVDGVVKELGLGILRKHRHDPIAKDDLLAAWKKLAGDTFEPSVSLKLLEANYIETIDTMGNGASVLRYFPASELPVDPAARFSDLFLTRSIWRGEEISPFLSDIAVNSKERDKLLLKYCRTVTGPEGIRYTARAQYNG